MRHVNPTIAKRILALQSEAPVVSIVIPAFNEEKYLRATLDSLSRIVTSHPIEIIGINNASHDATREIFEKHNVIVFDEPRKGLPFARALGIRKARGQFIIQLDADTKVPTTWINAHMEHFNNSEVVAVQGTCHIIGVHPLIWLWCYGSKLFRKLLGEERQVLYWSGPNNSYRKEIVLNLLEKYSSYPFVDEDMEMLRLLRREGLVIEVKDKKMDNFISGRKFRSNKIAFNFIFSSIARKIHWRYEKLQKPLYLEDVR